MTIVSNTSPITNLAAIAQLDLLYQLYIPVVRPYLDALVDDAGFWMTNNLYQRILQIAQE